MARADDLVFSVETRGKNYIMTSLSENRKGGSNEFSQKSFDGRRGKIVCSKCLQDKKQSEVTQVRDDRSVKYVCKNCGK